MDDSTELVKPDNITREEFLQWRSPRQGKTNPQRMTNAVWEYLVKNRLDAYTANALFDGPSSLDAGPCWCFDRFGQSETLLPDGTTLFIGGEHEDFYDPDFYIYNDVILIDKNGGIEILGYPADIFPPTDFHSATLAGNVIFIGSYHPGQTVYAAALDGRVFPLPAETFPPATLKTFLTKSGDETAVCP
ncbi:MAG: hypothetical protein LBH00_03945 [Planctomycetaceae bacterium]|jgi:hypothetical protein|nr:hypothetical protein [Planctomycetaceae bacterium]